MVDTRTTTVPDEEARKDPRHKVLAKALRFAHVPQEPGSSGYGVERVWGRASNSGNQEGAAGNAWAGTPEDVADVLVRALWAREETDRETYREQLRALPEAQLHRDRMHPDWEYATTEGQRKTWDDADVPPEGDGWVRNVEAGRDGWDRFDYTEESYWRRTKMQDHTREKDL